MSELSLDATNTILLSSDLPVRLKPQGFDALKLKSGFRRALEFCLNNPKAKEDVMAYIGSLGRDASLVHYLNETSTPQPTVSRPVDSDLRAERHETVEPPPQSSTPARNFDGHHIYGAKAALYFAVDETRAGDATLAIDGAKSVGEKQYDWKGKLRIQITRGDLPTVAAVLFGLLPECELSRYGADNSKRLLIKNQGKNFFLNMSGKGYPQIAVPISPADLFEIRSLCLQQLLANRPAIGVEGMLANLKLHARMIAQ